MENQPLNKFDKLELVMLNDAVVKQKNIAKDAGAKFIYETMCQWESWIKAAISDSEFEADAFPNDTPIIGIDGNLYVKG